MDGRSSGSSFLGSFWDGLGACHPQSVRSRARAVECGDAVTAFDSPGALGASESGDFAGATAEAPRASKTSMVAATRCTPLKRWPSETSSRNETILTDTDSLKVCGSGSMDQRFNHSAVSNPSQTRLRIRTRANRLSFAATRVQGARSVEVRITISFTAASYSSHFSRLRQSSAVIL